MPITAETLAQLDVQTKAAADFTTLKATGQQIIVQTQALVTQANALKAAVPAQVTEIDAALTAFKNALKAILT